MENMVKKIILSLLLLLSLAAAGYGAFLLYNYIVKDVTAKVKRGVSEGIADGVGDIVNPLSWPKKLIGQ